MDDAQFLVRLAEFDKITLEYGLLHYKHRWSTVDGRVSLLVGDIRKIGIFPAFAAAATSCHYPSQARQYFHAVGALDPGLLFLSDRFYATGRRERPDQVIALLELVIRHERTRFSNRAPEQHSSGNTINSNGCFNNF
ncbi:hypothetical protein [Xanthomonas cissicola]|uniref:hypothetical protein n=1 Tax=Xanthomonas cissicola TaxID=86186 RepID=UPI001F1EBEA7|nr:hypothetical protein [Xanthomonas cissicola]